MEKYRVVGKNGKELHSSATIHPGEIIRDELEAREIKKAQFAKMLGIRPGHLSDLMAAKRHISAGTAIKLEKLLGISAEYWLRVQMYYDLHIEREKLNRAA